MRQKPDQDRPAGLYIVATPIGNMGDMTLRAIDILNSVDVIACEDTRETGKLTAAYDVDVKKIPYHDHNASKARPEIVSMIREGKRVALLSDAGMPLISDPGYKLVRDCVEAGLYVTCAPGATASLTALVLSGLPTDRFMFAGFLPPKSAARRQALGEVAHIPATLVFYETAPRLADSLTDMLEILGDRPAAVARELTKKFEEVRRERLSVLAEHYKSDGAPKGEIVVVVGAPEEKAATVDIDALLKDALDSKGMSVKDAATFIAAKTGLKKRDVYQQALLLAQKKK